MARPTGWDVLGLDGDPTPGDPERMRQLAGRFHDFAETAHRAKLAVDSLQGDGSLLTWVGLSGDAFRDRFGEFPTQVQKLYQSHLMAGDALEDFAPTLETAQGQADRALADGKAAAEKLATVKAALGVAETDFSGASQAAQKAQAETAAPDPDQVKQAVADADAAKQRLASAQGRVNAAQGELDLAKQLAMQAKELRDGGARTAQREIDAASDAGIQPRSFWQKLGDAFKELWNIICEVAKWVALVAGIIGMIIGGPLAWIALFAGAILLVKAIVDFAQGKGSVMDLVFGLLGVIPGVRGLTSLSRLSQLYKAGGLKEIGKAALTGMKNLAKDMVGLVKAAGQGALTLIKKLGDTTAGAVGSLKLDNLTSLVNRPFKPLDTATDIKIRECVTDPIDVATGEAVLDYTDPGGIARTHVSTYRAGHWFGASWASTLDERIETDEEGSCFFAADGVILVYPAADPGVATLPVEGPRRALVRHADGSAELYAADEDRVRHFGPGGELVAVEDPRGRTEITWVEGAPARLTRPDGSVTEIRTHDQRVRSVRGPGGAESDFSYDERGRLVDAGGERYTYDDQGRVTGWQDRHGFAYRYTYDDAGRCVRTAGNGGYLDGRIEYDTERRTTTFTDALGNRTVYALTDRNRVASRTDPLGRVTSYAWDEFGRRVSQTDPLGLTTRYEYDADGMLVAIVRPDGSRVAPDLADVPDSGGTTEPGSGAGAGGAAAGVEYGPFGVVVARTDATGARTTFDYDAELRLVAVTDARGLVWRYEYDAAGQLVAETDFNGRTQRFGHDAGGRLTSIVTALGETLTFGYDTLGRVVERGTPAGTTRYAYDGAGRLVSAVDDESALTFERDARGRVVAQHSDDRTLRFEYLDAASTRRRSTPSGAASSWTFDERGLPVALDAAGEVTRFDYADGRERRRTVGDRVLLEQEFGPDGALAAQDVAGSGTRRFTYRADGQPTGVDDPRTGRLDLELDAAGRVLAARGPGRDETYRFDAAGNIASAGGAELRYERGLVREAGGFSYDYDAEGRLVSRSSGGRTWTFEWNALDRLVAVVTPEGERWHYRYDPLGRRTAKLRHSPAGELVERYDFAWDAATMVEEVHTRADGSTRVTTWEHHPATRHPVARVRGGEFASVVADRVGTPTDLVGADGAALWHADTTVWGAVRGGDGEEMPLRFPGQYHDAETGLHYNVYRYYDPATARYVTQDPLGLGPAPDPAAYVGNPFADADPLGLMPLSCNAKTFLKLDADGSISRIIKDRGQIVDSTRLDDVAGAAVVRPPLDPDAIIAAYKTDGLLVRTLDNKKAIFELANSGIKNADDTIDAGRGALSWSLIHQNHEATLFKFGPDADGGGAFGANMRRNMAILVDPAAMKIDGDMSRMFKFSTKDMSSNGVATQGDQVLDMGKAMEDLAKMRSQLPAKADGDTNEVLTFGLGADDVVGFLYKGKTAGETWDVARPQFQAVVDQFAMMKTGLYPETFVKSPFKDFHVFTLDGDNQLVKLDTLTAAANPF